MRRILSGANAYFTDLAHALHRSWVGFFFTPADPSPLALIRVLAGSLAFWNLVEYAADFDAFLGPNGWGTSELARTVAAERYPTAWSFWFWIPACFGGPVLAGCLIVVGFFTIGLWSRTMAILSWAIVISTSRRTLMAGYGFDQILSALTFYLMVGGASGQALSLDRFLARAAANTGSIRHGTAKRLSRSNNPIPTVSANLSLRLIQLHWCLIYGMAGLGKLQGKTWWNGEAAWLVITTAEYPRRFDLTGLAAHPVLLNLATHVTIVLELGFPILIWVRLLRPLQLAGVVLMHLAIDLGLGLTEFSLAMIAGVLAFLSEIRLRGTSGQGQATSLEWYESLHRPLGPERGDRGGHRSSPGGI